MAKLVGVKGQTAIGTLLVYGFVLVIISIAGYVLIRGGIIDSTSYASSHCVGLGKLSYRDHLLPKNGQFRIEVGNGVGYRIDDLRVVEVGSSHVSCGSGGERTMRSGSFDILKSGSCETELEEGESYQVNITIEYSLKGLTHRERGECTGRIEPGRPTFEVGDAEAGSSWVSVEMENTYISPVVVASFLEESNTLPASVRIANVTSNSFDLKLQNPGNSSLSEEEVHYLVVEEGRWTLDGVKLEAHKYDTDTVGHSGDWDGDAFFFAHSFSSPPVVLHQVMSSSDSSWITTWVSDPSSAGSPPTATGLQIGLNGAEATTSHGEETVGWVAIENQTQGETEEFTFGTMTVSGVKGHDNGCFSSSLPSGGIRVPKVVASQLSMAGSNGGWSVLCQLSGSSVGVHIEEDQEADSERSHADEEVGVVFFRERD